MGLKNSLKHYICQRGHATYDALDGFIRQNGYKTETFCRRMREICREGNIQPITNQKGYIVGYELVKVINIASSPEGVPQRQLGGLKQVPWREKLRLENEKRRIAKMPRIGGRIVAC